MNPNTAPPRPKNATLWDPYCQGPAVRSVNVREVVAAPSTKQVRIAGAWVTRPSVAGAWVTRPSVTVTINPSVKQVRAALIAAKKQEFQRIDKKMRRDLKRAAGRAAGTRP